MYCTIANSIHNLLSDRHKNLEEAIPQTVASVETVAGYQLGQEAM